MLASLLKRNSKVLRVVYQAGIVGVPASSLISPLRFPPAETANAAPKSPGLPQVTVGTALGSSGLLASAWRHSVASGAGSKSHHQ